MGPKKGVISQPVKDVVQSLVDDDLVLKDKIGTSVRFTILLHVSRVVGTLTQLFNHHHWGSGIRLFYFLFLGNDSCGCPDFAMLSGLKKIVYLFIPCLCIS
jgi:hypothetical protein